MNIKNKKRIAILLATYNGEKFISEQLNSLLSQTNQDWCCYIHDDGSKDATVTICKEYCAKFPNKFVLLNSPSTGGAKKNFMHLLSCVESEYYMFCDQDDVWMDFKIDITLEAMQFYGCEQEKPILIFTDLAVVDKNLNVIASSMDEYQKLECSNHSFNKLLIQNVVTGCTTMINCELHDMMLKECNLDNVIMHDWWAALIASRYGIIQYIAESTIKYRQHGNNTVGAKSISSFEYISDKLSNFGEIKKSLNLTRIQASEFSKVFGEPIDSVSNCYAHIDEKSKISRLLFYYGNGVCKASLMRNIGLILVG